MSNFMNNGGVYDSKTLYVGNLDHQVLKKTGLDQDQNADLICLDHDQNADLIWYWSGDRGADYGPI